jgi:hypothetical protein
MNRKELIAKLEEINSKGLQSAVLIFYSPLSETVEERHIYADNFNEVFEWADSLNNKYMNSSIPAFIIYINNELRYHKNQLGDYINE